MTQPAQQPESQFTIWSYELDELTYGDRLETKKKLNSEIRSRPHPAPTDEQCRICSQATAKAEREDALNEFMMAIEYRFEDTNNGRGFVGTIRGIKESLRTNTEAQQ